MTRVLLIGALLAVNLAGAERLPPVDESSSDPSFLAFKVKLIGALERRDVKSLVAALDPKVRVRFGAPDGVAAFRRHWNLDRPAQSKLWSELGMVLRLGATRDETEFIAPYVFTKFPQTLDAYTHAAVVRPGAAMRRSPAVSAPKTTDLDYNILLLPGQRRNGWVEAQTGDGKAGWVQERDIRSPLQYRAFFEKRNGEWKLTAFVTGD